MKTRFILVAVLAVTMAVSDNTGFAQSMRGMGMPSMGGGGTGTTQPGNTGGTPTGGVPPGGTMGGMSNGLLNSYGGGGSGYSGTTTVAGSYLSGEAALAQAVGQYNYDSARAARQLEEATREAIGNQLEAQQAYYEMRRFNKANWLADHPRLTTEQIAQINRSGLPRRLRSNELDPASGLIRWPAVLERPEFETIRQQLDDNFAHRSAEQFGVGSAVYGRTQSLAHEMRARLDQEVKSMSQMEWIQAMRFIESLAYETRFAPETATGKLTIAK